MNNEGNYIVLVGPQGSGKTTIGRELAKRLGLPFQDQDDLYEELYKIGIGSQLEKFPVLGRFREFRLLEAQLDGIGDCGPCIISTGGGVIRPTTKNLSSGIVDLLTKRNKRLLDDSIVIYLQNCQSTDEIARLSYERRSQGGADRRIDFGGGDFQGFKEMIEHRHPYYLDVANIVSLGDESAEEITERLYKEIRDYDRETPLNKNKILV